MNNTDARQSNYSNMNKRSGSVLRDMATTHVPTLVLRCKTVLVGEAHVGKTAIVQMLTSNKQTYPKGYNMTAGAEINMHQIFFPEKHTTVEHFIFDIGGQSVFNQLDASSHYFENASFFLLVVDVSDNDSIQSMTRWVQQIRTSGSTAPLIIVMSKVDKLEVQDLDDYDRGHRDDNRLDEIRGFCSVNGFLCFSTSAKQGEGISEVFEAISKQFIGIYEETVERASRLTSS